MKHVVEVTPVFQEKLLKSVKGKHFSLNVIYFPSIRSIPDSQLLLKLKF